MPGYIAPLNDMKFVIEQVFKAEEVWSSMDKTRDVTPDLANAILEQAANIAENLIAPLSRNGDEEGVKLEGGKVITPKGYKEAYNNFAENQWGALGGNPQYGGQGIPKMLSVLFEEMMQSADSSFYLYSALTSGAALAIDAHATEELKSRYLPKLYSSEWSGVMCLTESHAGSDLSTIRTKAVDNGDGSYAITGNKIFISGGEQDLTSNIIHLVLAKLPDAPAGNRGISLFLVAKNLVNDDGSIGEANQVSCGSIEEKMGMHASATCVMNFDGSKGFLVGELNQGLNCMFTMMNYERLSVGIQGVGCAEMSYQGALTYAKDRLQGRATSGAVDKSKAGDPIIVHPDVRRMLLTQKSLTEAGRAFAVYVGMQLDYAKFGDKKQSERGGKLLALLTPVAKAFLTDMGLDICIVGQQVYGGHGFIREWGMEQLVRDVRIAQIYEGTNGIQALDLVRRKVLVGDGELVRLFSDEISEFVDSKINSGELQEFIDATKSSLAVLNETTQWIIDKAANDPDEAGASSVEYLHLFGYTAYAYMWARMLDTAINQAGSDSSSDQGAEQFKQSKLHTGRFYIKRILPRINGLAESIRGGSETVMAMDESLF